jgi:3-deoxy-D-manno-octulosonic-acid transferase
MFSELKNNRIPLVLLNARLTLKTQNKWMKIKNFAKSIFDKVTVIYPQNRETKSFLKKIKLKNIKLIGNLKFTEDPNENLGSINSKLKYEFTKKKVWVASSTHNNEEIFCAKTHIELKKKIKNLITIIIPRHIHRVNEIVDEIEKLSLKVCCHSSSIKNLRDIDIYIVDTFGETKKFHKLASSVFLGGSIINRGGQNPLEAARFGAKIFHGPNTDNFKDVYKLLKNFKISKQINTPTQLASSIIFKKNKHSGSRIKNIGDKILKKTIKELDNLFNNEFKKT